jgi:hypothetical protein
MKNIRIIHCKGSGMLVVDEHNIITDASYSLKDFVNKNLSYLEEKLSPYGKVVFRYILYRRDKYESYSKRPGGSERRNRFGQNKFG